MAGVENKEALQSPEVVVFGEYEQRAVPVDNLVVLSQVRSGLNPDLKDIKGSVKANGLLNPIDVAVMDEWQLEEYISFVNTLWGTTTSIEEFTDKQDVDGFYTLVIAGHTRTEAVTQLQAEDDLGRAYAIMAKVHKVSNPSEIIALQLDENLHSKPQLERQAMAIVEAYEYGRIHNQWSTPTEFAKLNKDKFSRKMLADALGFAHLPDRARDFVFSGSLSYTAAVELGRASETVLDSVAAGFGFGKNDAIPEERLAEFGEAYSLKIATLIGHIQAEGLNTSAAKKYIQGQATLMRESAAKLRGEMDENDSLFDMSMLDADDQSRIYLAKLRQELWAEHQKIARLANGGATILRIHSELTGVDTVEAQETHRRSVQRVRAMGSTALDT
ncbi:TPA: hypothetical protein DCF80_00285, partial [Candidatus Saccharibacteria bacterium]|nr:hypothetical protein [Candidatus Saccharibacteria bacterium]